MQENSLLKPKMTPQQLKELRERLPKRSGMMGAIAKACSCSQSKVSRVFAGHINDLAVITVAMRMAEEYEKNCRELADSVALVIRNSMQK